MQIRPSSAVTALVVIVFLSACSGGGSLPNGSTSPPNAVNPPPTGGSVSSNAFSPSNVKIKEVADPLNVGPPISLANATVGALAVSPTGTVYLGSGGGNGGSLLYSYNGATFTPTQPAYTYCTKDVTTCCNAPICTGNGVTAIDAAAADVNSIFWAGESALEGVPNGLIFEGANGVKASAPPAPYNSLTLQNGSFWFSLVTDQNGKLWAAGGGLGGAFGYPVNLSSLPCTPLSTYPFTNCWDALVLANGPNHHVWGAMHSAPPSLQGWPIPPSQTTGSVVVEFDPSGTVLHSYNVSGYIGGIAGGADGGLWFTNQTANTIERISGTGSVSQFAIPTASSGASSIALAADGALWFTESNVNKVARIDTSGHFNEFSLPTANSNPVAVAANPNSGACSPDVIWVLEAGSNQLAQITY